jgi:hypothetical protein
MQNLDEKIDLILETSLDEAPARIGTISARDLLSTKKDTPKEEPTSPKTPEQETPETPTTIPKKRLPQDIKKALKDLYFDDFSSLVGSQPEKDFSDEDKKEVIAALQKDLIAYINGEKGDKSRTISFSNSIAVMQSISKREGQSDPYPVHITRREIKALLKSTGLVPDNMEEQKYIDNVLVSPREFEKQRRKKQQQPERWLDVSEQRLNEDKLAEITINFSELRKQQINESFLAMFGGWVEHILKSMFGGGYSTLPVQVVGTKRELESFTSTIGSEKRYIESARRHGLDHPTTYKNKAKLDVAVKNFEKDTGLKWPFK